MGRPAVAIPEKLFFKIGEVCELAGVQAHVLRYWESEFPMLAPQKNRAGQRVYRKRDVEIALRIKELLYEDQYTIAGRRSDWQTICGRRQIKDRRCSAAMTRLGTTTRHTLCHRECELQHVQSAATATEVPPKTAMRVEKVAAELQRLLAHCSKTRKQSCTPLPRSQTRRDNDRLIIQFFAEILGTV